MSKKDQSQTILKLLRKAYRDVKGTALYFRNALELLVATILSAQCTDERVNKVTEVLFKKYKTAKDYSEADLKELRDIVKPTGFYRNKAAFIKESAKQIVEEFNSKVPSHIDDLTKLHGVARKTANIVLSNAYGVIVGIAVDTHVRRLSKLLGLTENTNPDKIEKDLMQIVPESYWKSITNLLIYHGRAVCVARKPKCSVCSLSKICPSAFKA